MIDSLDMPETRNDLPPRQPPDLFPIDLPSERCPHCDDDSGLAPICVAHGCPYHQLNGVEN